MEFLLVLLVSPIIVIVASIIGMFLFKKWFVLPLSTFVIFSILTFTVFNESFIIWVVVYTIISIIISLIMKFIMK